MIKKTFTPIVSCFAALVLAFGFSSCATVSKKTCCSKPQCPTCCSSGKCTAGQPQSCSK